MKKDPASALLTIEEAAEWRKELRRRGLRLVVTNGCFDLVHKGHASYLYEAAKEGDALLVLLNSDASVRALKGSSRPIVPERERAYLLGALESVDRVVLFAGSRCDRELERLAPDVYTKAGDYTIETLDPSERAALEKSGTRVVFMPFVPGFSTTGIVEKIQRDLKNSQ